MAAIKEQRRRNSRNTKQVCSFRQDYDRDELLDNNSIKGKLGRIANWLASSLSLSRIAPLSLIIRFLMLFYGEQSKLVASERSARANKLHAVLHHRVIIIHLTAIACTSFITMWSISQWTNYSSAQLSQCSNYYVTTATRKSHKSSGTWLRSKLAHRSDVKIHMLRINQNLEYLLLLRLLVTIYKVMIKFKIIVNCWIVQTLLDVCRYIFNRLKRYVLANRAVNDKLSINWYSNSNSPTDWLPDDNYLNLHWELSEVIIINILLLFHIINFILFLKPLPWIRRKNVVGS